MIALAERPASQTALLSDWRAWARACSIQPLRSMREFAESEIIVPDGPYKGRRFKCHTQPWTRLWFEAIDSGHWQRFAATGPSQSGKTLCCYVIPTMYHLFEIGETVICAVPKMEMAHDKWEQDFAPAIRASRYAGMIPKSGKGSRGGQFESITFTNGATLKFMTGGGDDKSRAGFTSRVVVITEVDGFDKASVLSREANPITQLEARTRAHGHRRRIYLECTVSTEEGRIWQEVVNGSDSKIAIPCPHCDEFVTPERQHFIGWDGAENAIEAETKGGFFCPLCGTRWSEEQRVEANRRGLLVHRGQSVEGGQVVGPIPPTRTLGFRWTATNNQFITSAELGAEEWDASRQLDQEDAQRGRDQFVWTIPADPTTEDAAELSVESIIGRQSNFVRGDYPPNTQALTVGVDVGKFLLHYTVKAWTDEPHGLTIDYGVAEVHSRDLTEDGAIIVALRELRARLEQQYRVTIALVDSGNWTDTVYAACAEFGVPWYPSKGFGASSYSGGKYRAPSDGSGGDGWHIGKVARASLVEFDADAWKSRVHSRLECDPSQAGAIQLFRAESKEHISYGKHLTAEKKVIEYDPGKGNLTKWVSIRKANHWLDTEVLANVGADCAGVEIVHRDTPAVESQHGVCIEVETRPDGRGWFD